MTPSEIEAFIEYLLLRKWPYAKDICLVALLTTGCIRTRNANPKKTWHPLHDFVHTFLTTAASGIMGPILVDERANPLVNDAFITYFIVIWLLFYRFEFLVKFFCLPGVHQILVIFTTLSRGNNVCAFTDKGYKRALKYDAVSIYPIPVFGALIAGMVRGSGGLYFPPEKGIGGFKNGAPFNAQIALVSAIAWHFLVNDRHFVGNFLRESIKLLTAGYFPKPVMIKCAIVFFICSMNVMQSFSQYKTTNPLNPMWKVLSSVTGVPRSTVA